MLKCYSLVHYQKFNLKSKYMKPIENNSVKIISSISDTYILDISFKNLSWDNIQRLEFVFSEYIKKEEDGVKKWSEKEKQQWSVKERMHPAIEMRNLIRKAILRLNPHVIFYE